MRESGDFKMKRIICLLLCLALLFMVCGCSSESDNNSSETSTTQNTDTKEETLNSETGESNNDSSTQTETTSDGESTQKENSETSNPTENTNTNTTINTGCSHSNTTLKNKVSATCKSVGYTGDTYCTDCGKKIATGTRELMTAHTPKLINQKDATTTSEGFTGDKICSVCNVMLENGKTIPKIEENIPAGKTKYTTNNGYEYIVDEGTDITAYTMALRTKKINDPYRAAELEILRLCNIEREKVGLAPLEWYDDAYYFTHIRAEEIYVQWGHERPDWSQWHTVYTDAGVILHCSYGENLARFQGPSPETVAQRAVEGWMESPGHRANILNENYTKMTVSLEYGADNFTLCAVQHFFGDTID